MRSRPVRRATKFVLPAVAGVVVVGALSASSCAGDIVVGPRPQAVDDRFVAEPPGIAVESWVEGLKAPWSLVFLPDGRALVSERAGRIRLIADGTLRPAPFAALDVATGGEGGLMGLALHPAFPDPPYLYAMRTVRVDGSRTNQVTRLVLDGGTARVDKTVFAGIPGARNHNGGRIAFGPDGMLYVATGEIFEADLAQDRASLGGKVLRLTPDGAVPPDNPDPASPVYSLGHRNVQGLAWQPETGDLFLSEHGPSGEFLLGAYDEVNVGVPGGNFGWPRAVGAPGLGGLVDPLVAWPEVTAAPSGIAFWHGDLYVAALRGAALIRIALDRAAGAWRVTAVERWFNDDDNGVLGRLRDAVVGPDGALYVLTSNRDGRGDPRPGDDKILRLSRAP